MAEHESDADRTMAQVGRRARLAQEVRVRTAARPRSSSSTCSTPTRIATTASARRPNAIGTEASQFAYYFDRLDALVVPNIEPHAGVLPQHRHRGHLPAHRLALRDGREMNSMQKRSGTFVASARVEGDRDPRGDRAPRRRAGDQQGQLGRVQRHRVRSDPAQHGHHQPDLLRRRHQLLRRDVGA